METRWLQRYILSLITAMMNGSHYILVSSTEQNNGVSNAIYTIGQTDAEQDKVSIQIRITATVIP